MDKKEKPIEFKPVDIKFKVDNPLDLVQQEDTATAVTEFFVSQRLKQASTTVPVGIPYEFKDQFFFYENGTTRRLYININGTWQYTELGSSSSLVGVRAITDFETAARFYPSSGGGGSSTFGVDGLAMSTSAGAGGYAKQLWTPLTPNNNSDLLENNPTFRATVFCKSLDAANGEGEGIVAIGGSVVIAAGITLTTYASLGFYIHKESGVVSLYAFTSNASTSTLSSALTTLADNDALDLMVKRTGTASVDFYYSKNGAALSSATNISTTVPNGPRTPWCVYGVSNHNTAYTFDLTVTSSGYER